MMYKSRDRSISQSEHLFFKFTFDDKIADFGPVFKMCIKAVRQYKYHLMYSKI